MTNKEGEKKVGNFWENKYKSLPIQAKASCYFLICSFFQRGISTVTTPVFTRLLSTEEYGQYNVFNSWMNIITVFVTLNLSYGVYAQGLVKFEEEKKLFTSSLQGLTLFLVVVWTVVYLLFRDFWNFLFHLTTVQVLAMLVMIWTTAVFNFWAAEQRAMYKYRALVAVTIGVSLAKPIVGVLFVILAEDKVTARILGLMLIELAGYTAFFFIHMYRGKRFFSRKFWVYALGFNIPLIPHYLSQTVLNSADRIMIRDMVGAEEAGIYSLAYSISLIMTLFNTALMNTISPWIYQKIKLNKVEDIAPIAYITLVGIAGANLLLIAFAPEVVRIFAPASYYGAIYVIPPVAMSVYFLYCYDLFAKFAFYYEKIGFIMAASVAGAVLNIVLNYFFIRLCGYKAAGYTTLVCYIIYCVCHYLFMDKVCDQFCSGIRPYDVRKIVRITILFLGAGFILLFLYNYVFIRYGMIAIVCITAIIRRRELSTLVKRVISVKKV
jgi:O-antigen/teichoic acid export membrane protein